MFDNMKEAVNDWNDDEEIKKYLRGILDKRLYDKSGLIYGIGHAVYAISDPRAILLKQFTEKLAVEKGRTDELALYKNVERLAPDVISKAHKRKKVVSANVDFYSGFVYSMLGLPDELYTPLLQLQECQVGVLIELKKSLMQVKLFVLHIRTLLNQQNMFH